MLLSPDEAERFFRLHRSLMFFINRRLRLVPDKPATPDEFSGLPPEARAIVRDALPANLDLIEAFVAESSRRFKADDLEIVRSWRHLEAGKFYIWRELAKYTVFLSSATRPVAYGVLALSQTFEEMLGPYRPLLVTTILLPFQDKIVYDGLLNSYNVSFGPGIRRFLNEDYKKAKARDGIVTSLPLLDQQPTARSAKGTKAAKAITPPKAKRAKKPRVKKPPSKKRPSKAD